MTTSVDVLAAALWGVDFDPPDAHRIAADALSRSPELASAMTVAELVRDSAMAMESWHNVKVAMGLGFHSGAWSSCLVPLCRRWVEALTGVAP